MINCANYQGAGTTGRFSQASKYESRGYSSNCLTSDAFKLAVDGPWTIMMVCL